MIRDILKAAGLEQHFHDGIVISGKRGHVNSGTKVHGIMRE